MTGSNVSNVHSPVNDVVLPPAAEVLHRLRCRSPSSSRSASAAASRIDGRVEQRRGRRRTRRGRRRRRSRRRGGAVRSRHVGVLLVSRRSAAGRARAATANAAATAARFWTTGRVRAVRPLPGGEDQRAGGRGQHGEQLRRPLDLPRWAGPNACRQTVKNTTVSMPAGDAHRRGVGVHLRRASTRAGTRPARPPGQHRRGEQHARAGPAWPATRRQVRRQPDERRDGGDGQEHAAVEPALGQERLVEQRQPGRDQPVERGRQREHPERRRPQGLPERQARSAGAAPLAVGVRRRPPAARGRSATASTPNPTSTHPIPAQSGPPVGVRASRTPPSPRRTRP